MIKIFIILIVFILIISIAYAACSGDSGGIFGSALEEGQHNPNWEVGMTYDFGVAIARDICEQYFSASECEVGLEDPYDINNDGIVNCNDLMFIRECLGDVVGVCEEADLNEDDIIDIFDLVSFTSGTGIECPSCTIIDGIKQLNCYDINNDGLTDCADLDVIVSCQGQAPIGSCVASDVNDDTTINVLDTIVWKNNVGLTCSGIEPLMITDLTNIDLSGLTNQDYPVEFEIRGTEMKGWNSLPDKSYLDFGETVNEQVRLNIVYLGEWIDIEQADYITLTYDGGQTLDIHLPSIYQWQDATLYISSTGDTYYDEALTQEACVGCTIQTCSISGDTYPSCDGIDRTELGFVISGWISEDYTRNELGEAISSWVS